MCGVYAHVCSGVQANARMQAEVKKHLVSRSIAPFFIPSRRDLSQNLGLDWRPGRPRDAVCSLGLEMHT